MPAPPPRWPDEPVTPARPDWRETLTTATDLALVGFAVVVAALPVVTAGAAVATGSYAVGHWCAERRFPPVARLARRFVGWLLPGAVATLLVAVAGVLLATDLALLAAGRVPGGPAVLAATAAATAWAAAIVVLAVLRIGRRPDDGWRAATRWALATGRRAPHRAAAPLAVTALAVLLATMIPATLPLLVGYGLFAAHVVARRTLPDRPTNHS